MHAYTSIKFPLSAPPGDLGERDKVVCACVRPSRNLKPELDKNHS